jgi:hypothetical protein
MPRWVYSRPFTVEKSLTKRHSGQAAFIAWFQSLRTFLLDYEIYFGREASVSTNANRTQKYDANTPTHGRTSFRPRTAEAGRSIKQQLYYDSL